MLMISGMGGKEQIKFHIIHCTARHNQADKYEDMELKCRPHSEFLQTQKNQFIELAENRDSAFKMNV